MGKWKFWLSHDRLRKTVSVSLKMSCKTTSIVLTVVTGYQPKRGGLSLTLTDKTLGFAWQGSYYSTHHRVKGSDWLSSQTQELFLVETLSSISLPICTSSQPNFYHIQPFHIHIQQASHISHMNLPTYNIRATAQPGNDHEKLDGC